MNEATISRLRSRGPIVKVGRSRWFVTGFEAAETVLRNRCFVTGNPAGLGEFTGEGESDVLLLKDGEPHRRIRNAILPALHANVLSDLEPQLASVATSLLDACDFSGPVDAATDYALPLATEGICAFLGVPRHDQHQLTQRSLIVARGLDRTTTVESLTSITVAGKYLRDYFDELLKQDLGGDTALVRCLLSSYRNGLLNAQEVTATLSLLFVAGQFTSASLIAEGILLCSDPLRRSQLTTTDDNDAHIELEEIVRIASPVKTATTRWATGDVQICGERVRAGDEVIVIVNAANDDLARLLGDRMIEPANHNHLGFGAGQHYCLGAPLARMEGRVGLGHFLKRLPSYEMQGAPVYENTTAGTRLLSLRVVASEMVQRGLTDTFTRPGHRGSGDL